MSVLSSMIQTYNKGVFFIFLDPKQETIAGGKERGCDLTGPVMEILKHHLWPDPPSIYLFFLFLAPTLEELYILNYN